MAERIASYPNPFTIFGTEAVELTKADIPEYAPLVLGVLIAAYTRRLCYEGAHATPEMISEHFGDAADGRDVDRYESTMESSMENGSRYVAVHLLNESYERTSVVSVGKSTPSRPRRALLVRARPKNVNCFVNDILSVQGYRGYGSTALHATILPYHGNREVIVDAFGRPTDNDQNEVGWYRMLGLVPKGKIETPFMLRGYYTPPQTRMAGANVAKVREILINRSPWIAKAQMPHE